MSILKFVNEMLDYTSTFKNVVHIHVSRNPSGDIVSSAPAKDRAIEIKAVSKVAYDDLQGAACLGNLPYLKSVINSSFARDVEPVFSFSPTSNGRTNALKTIHFGNAKSDLLYQATDPYIGNITLPQKSQITEWPLRFVAGPDLVRQFKEMRSIQALSPNSKGSEIFNLVFADDTLIASFGAGNDANQANLVLSDTVEQFGKNVAVRSYFLSTDFIRVLELAGPDAVVWVHDKALRVDFESELAIYNVTLTYRKISEH